MVVRDDKRRRRKPKKCEFCEKKGLVPDYKKVDHLKRYISDKGKIYPARVTGCCAKHQRVVTREIKKARNIALLPYTIQK